MALQYKAINSAIGLGGSLLNFNCFPRQNLARYKRNISSDGPPVLPPCLLSTGEGCNPNEPTMYEARKYGHSLPTNTVTPCFEILPGIPSGVFRCTEGEVLGNGAGKCCYYLNPEYFSFHHMSFYDFHLHLRKYRQACPDSGRKPP